MPKLTKLVPKYRKHSSGEARVTINGRDYLLGPWNSKTSIREYDRIVAEFLSSGRSPTFGLEAESYSVAMLIRDYMRHCRSYYGTKVTSEYHRIKPAIKPLRNLYADYEAEDFGPVQYKAVRQTMIEAGLTRQGINSRMKKIVRAFKWAAAEGKLPAAVFETLRLIPSLSFGRTKAPDTEPVKPVEDAIVQATLERLSPIVGDMVRLQRILGCRPSEVCNLTPAAIDRSEDVWVAELVDHKTQYRGHRRKLFAGPKAQAILLPYLDRGEDENLFRPCEAVAMRRRKDAANRRTPLSCGNRPGKRSGGLRGNRARKPPGEAYTAASYRRAIHYSCDQAFPAPAPLGQRPGESDSARKRRLSSRQLKELTKWQADHRWGPNRLRHSRGTEVRKAFGLEAAQVTLGHRKADVTQIYAERNEELAKQVAREAG